MTKERWLKLTSVKAAGSQLWILAELEGHPVGTSIWYGDVDLDALRERIGNEPFERLCFHVAAFEINKLCSVSPTHLSFGPYARFVTPSFLEVWRKVLVKVWAQWRYEHEAPEWSGPVVTDEPVRGELPSARFVEEDVGDVLLFFGGGKDSLVAAKLLDDASVRWSSQTYAHSVYGPPDPQHALIDRLLDRLSPRRRHKQWVADDAFSVPLVSFLKGGGAKSFLAAETPSSIFGALPTVLAHGYRTMALAHEFSANRGNLIWSVTGEDVNHQWGKSWEAEQLLSTYIDRELVPGFRWFSILQPLSDVLIFELLRGAPREAVRFTHSCNLRKPWCHRCPKCAYVALSYAAHLPDGVYEEVFEEDVLDLPENLVHFRQMMGLEEHTPFECIGEIDEARLALALCTARGRRGRAIDLWNKEGGSLDLPAILARYAVVHTEAPNGIPAGLARTVMPAMKEAERAAHERIQGQLARTR